jgi:hypothetical protein
MKLIEVIVAPDGQTRIETKGFAGSACRQASAQLEQALGLRGCEQLTAEYHQQAESERCDSRNQLITRRQ